MKRPISITASAENSRSLPIKNERLAFTLLELLVVIFLVSLVAMMVFASMRHKASRHHRMEIPHLKDLAQRFPSRDAELICTTKCSECFIKPLGGKAEKLGGLSAPVASYILGKEGEARRIDFGRYRDQKICLRFRFYAEGSTSQMILRQKDKAYFIPAFFGAIRNFSSVEDAAQYWREKDRVLQNAGDYY